MTKLHHNLGMALRTVLLDVISVVCPLAFLTIVGRVFGFPCTTYLWDNIFFLLEKYLSHIVHPTVLVPLLVVVYMKKQ